MVRVQVEVTQEDIVNGQRRVPTSCPVALACRRELGNVRISVTAYYIRVNTGFPVLEIPETVKAFVRDFDGFRPVEPIKFTLEVPEELLSVNP